MMLKLPTCLVTLLPLLGILTTTTASTNTTTTTDSNKTITIHVEVNYGTLCPHSIWFIRTQLWPTYWTLYPLIKLDLYSFGRAEERLENGEYTFDCQHGELECQLNVIETCFQHLYENRTQDEKLAFVYCATLDPSLAAGEKCAKTYGIDWKKLLECSSGARGKELQHELGRRLGYSKGKGMYGYTSFVPHVSINGRWNYEYFDNFKDAVCSLIKGPTPEACL